MKTVEGISTINLCVESTGIHKSLLSLRLEGIAEGNQKWNSAQLEFF